MASYFRVNPETPDEYSPGGKVLVTLAGLAGVWGLGSVIYKYFSRPTETLSLPKTLLILRDLSFEWSKAFRQAAAQEEQIASRGGFSQAEIQMIASMMLASLQQALVAIDERTLMRHHVTKNQLRQACEAHANDPEVYSCIERLRSLAKHAYPNTNMAELSLEQAVVHMKYTLDLGLKVLEEVFIALGGASVPSNVRISPAFVNQFNLVYAKALHEKKQEYFEEHDIDGETLQNSVIKYQTEPVVREMLAQHSIEKRDVYNRLGLAAPM